MALTIKDIMIESLMYEHSKEYYDYTRECYELQLTEQFINNQLFMMENADTISESAKVFTEGYLHESVDETALEALMEKNEIKKATLKSKIVKGFMKVLRGLGAFLGKIGKVFDEMNAKAKACLRYLKSPSLKDEHILAVENIVKKALDESGFDPFGKQPYAKHVKFGAGQFSYTAKEGTALKNNLAAAFADDIALASVHGTKFQLSINEVIDAVMMIKNNKDNLSVPLISSVANDITNKSSYNVLHGIKMYPNNSVIDKQYEKVQEAIDFLNSYANEINKYTNDAVASATNVSKAASDYKANIDSRYESVDYDEYDDEEFTEKKNYKAEQNKDMEINGDAYREVKDDTEKKHGKSIKMAIADGVAVGTVAIVQAFNDLLATLTTSIGVILETYSSYKQYRYLIIEEVYKYFNERDEKAATT